MDNRFEVIEECLLQEQKNTKITLLQHKKTKAQILSCVNDDENKVFGVNFRTPPKNSTGVPHILEHSVLCGSKKYPTKEPFVELLKSSLQTFLNAFTYPDKTCYPVASTNVKDFYNLIDVYLDAVFHPNITEDIFKQEGWHIEASSVDEPISFKGVVYNEMKGVYSSPDSLIMEKSQNSLFPDITYSVDSGGEPNTILSLTYEEFLDFHTRYYHPSNARFFFWGNDDENTRLEKIAEVLEEYDYAPVDSVIPLQKAFDSPRYIEHRYESASVDKNTFVTCSILLPETTNAELLFALEILEYVLLGMPGSPLRKALIDSGLGTDITGGGLHTDLRQMYFSIGLKGVDTKDISSVEQCIYNTLKDIVHKGIAEDILHCAKTSIEFELRENNTSRFPVGLAQMVRCLTTWLYDSSPSLLLAFQKPLEHVKVQSSKYFVDIIQRHFLDNPSKTTVTLIPDAQLQSERIAKEQEKIAEVEQSLSLEAKKALVEETIRFTQQQSKADCPEALATIPKLSLNDIERKEKDVVLSVENSIVAVPLETSGIAYMDFYFTLDYVPQSLYPLLPLFSRALLEMGTKNRNYVELGIALSSSLGDIDFSPNFFIETGTQTIKTRFVLEMKAMYSTLPEAKEYIEDILHNPNFQDKERFLQILMEEIARVEQSIIPSGHSLVLSRIGAQHTNIGMLTENVGGMEYLKYIRALVQRVHKNYDTVRTELEFLHKAIFVRNDILLNIICEKKEQDSISAYCQGICTNLSNATLAKESLVLQPHIAKNEAFIAQSQVNYMCKGMKMYTHGVKYHASFAVASKYLRMGYLWEKVRVQGGAYGAFVVCNKDTGLLALASYRDPNTKNTLDIFDGAGQHLKKHTFTESEIESLCIATLGDKDTYLLPDAKGRQAFARYFTKETIEERQMLRDEIFSTTAKDIKAVGDVLEHIKNHGTVVALGGENVHNFAKEQGYTLYSVDSYE